MAWRNSRIRAEVVKKRNVPQFPGITKVFDLATRGLPWGPCVKPHHVCAFLLVLSQHRQAARPREEYREKGEGWVTFCPTGNIARGRQKRSSLFNSIR